MKHTFQVNMNFGDKGRFNQISAFPLFTRPFCVASDYGRKEQPTFAQNVPTLLRRLKTKYHFRLEDIKLEFQPED